jgi:hypothetical protein
VCTVSWSPLAGGYLLAMNRDERRTRAPAHPPELRQLGGIPVLMPMDGEAGGSWISLNGAGHTLALLNRWEESPRDPEDGWVSRGLLLAELSGLRNYRAAAAALEAAPLTRYRPFTLISVAPAEAPWLFEWNGTTLEVSTRENPGLLRTSSGFDQAAVEQARGELFQAAAGPGGELSGAQLAALHRSHLPARGPLSVCMHRDEAVTVSSSLITVTENKMSFRYVAGSPCISEDIVEQSIGPRRPA